MNVRMMDVVYKLHVVYSRVVVRHAENILNCSDLDWLSQRIETSHACTTRRASSSFHLRSIDPATSLMACCDALHASFSSTMRA